MQELERKWRKSKNEDDRDKYFQQQLVVNEMIVAAKSNFFKAKISEGDSKILFRTIDNLLNGSNKSLPVYESAEVMSNEFASFFKE